MRDVAKAIWHVAGSLEGVAWQGQLIQAFSIFFPSDPLGILELFLLFTILHPTVLLRLSGAEFGFQSPVDFEKPSFI